MGKGSNTTTTSSSSSADPQAASLYRDILTRAQGVASTPYQAYTGELTAPVNAQQQQGISGINAAAGYASPYITQAAGQATSSSAPITAQTIQGYQNPYTQQVVDATTAQLRNEFGQQQAGLTSNAISQGALGGNAVGVGRGILGGQQGRTMASTVAGLYDQSYKQALAAAQQQQQTGLAGANALASYGISGQSAALQGAGAQVGAGSLMQQNEQAKLDALYQQYAQAQAYPYQQAQWLAGIGTGVGSNLGGTSSGTSTGPAPNPTAQWLGLGLSAVGALSDRDAKQNIERVGEMNDGTPIYRFQYKGDDQWHIGPIAQDVEKRNPDAVSRGVDGMRYVDMHEASEGSVERAAGGKVEAPWGSVGQGWIPAIGISPGGGAPRGGAPSAPSDKGGGFDPSKMASGIAGAAKGIGGLDWGGAWDAGIGNLSGDAWGGGSFFGGDMYGGSSASPLPGLDASDYGPGFARGGGVAGRPRGYAFGGAPDMPVQDWLAPQSAFGEGEDVVPASEYNFLDQQGNPDPFGETNRIVAHDALRRGDGVVSYGDDTPVFDPDGRMMGNQTSAQGVSPAPTEAPVVAQDDEAASPPTDTSARSRGIAGPATGISGQDIVRPDSEERGGFGLLPISPNASTGLLTAGLGMMASRSPFLGTAVGEGGLAGVGAYGAAQQSDRRVAAEAAKLSEEARRHNEKFGLDLRKQGETERHNKATETINARGERPPMGMRFNAQGVLEPIPGWLPTLEKAAKARKGPEGELMDDQTAEFMADRIIAGDTKVLTGLGRGAQGAANIMKVQKLVAERAASGVPISAAAREILQNAAQFEGLKTAERTQAGIMAKLSVYGRTAFNATDIAEKLSAEVPRTNFQPINRVFNAARTNTGDPKVVALGQALMTLTNEYARAIGGGHGTVHDKEEAEKRLSMAQSHEQLKAVINVMRQEILAEERAMPAARQHIRDIYNPTPGGGGKSISGEHGAPPPAGPVSGASGIPSPSAREVNKVYNTPRGKMKWTGQGWIYP